MRKPDVIMRIDSAWKEGVPMVNDNWSYENELFE